MEELITQIRIKNFKCYEDIVVPLRKFTVIVGQNSSGKSTIFQALDVLRLAVVQLDDKKEHFNTKTNSRRSFSKNMLQDLRRLPWYRGGFRSWARDQEKPVTIGITFRVPSGKESEDQVGDKSYISIDVELGCRWNPTQGGSRGAGLPDSIRFRFFNWGGSNREKTESPCIDMTVKSCLLDESKGYRQVATLSLSQSLISHLSLGLSSDKNPSPSLPTINEVHWGECPYFQRASGRDGGVTELKPPLDGPLRNRINKELNTSLTRCWNILRTKLVPQTLLAEDTADAVHIRADDAYIVREKQEDKNTPDRIFENLTGKTSEVYKDFRLQKVDEKSEKEVTEILQNVLEQPYEVRIQEQEVFLKDLRMAGSNDMKNLVPLTMAGYGLQKVIPRLLVYAQQKPQFCVLEEPGTNAHPRLQGLLARALGKMLQNNGSGAQMVCETHSENFIRVMMSMVKGADKLRCVDDFNPEDVLFLYVDYPSDAPQPSIMYMRVDEKGELADPWPNGFFMERDLIRRGVL